MKASETKDLLEAKLKELADQAVLSSSVIPQL